MSNHAVSGTLEMVLSALNWTKARVFLFASGFPTSVLLDITCNKLDMFNDFCLMLGKFMRYWLELMSSKVGCCVPRYS